MDALANLKEAVAELDAAVAVALPILNASHEAINPADVQSIADHVKSQAAAINTAVTPPATTP